MLSAFSPLLREVIFFARVMQCLRRDCEILGADISAIDVWTPVAKKALHDMVYEDSTDTDTEGQGEKKGEKKGEKDEDDSSIWSPSRMILMLDTSKFELSSKLVTWLQAHPAVGQFGVDSLARLDASLPNSLKTLASSSCSTPQGILCLLLLPLGLALLGGLTALRHFPRSFCLMIAVWLVLPWFFSRQQKLSKLRDKKRQLRGQNRRVQPNSPPRSPASSPPTSPIGDGSGGFANQQGPEGKEETQLRRR